MAVMPMFPLGTVLLPGTFLPLHVFEPRYRALVRACLAGDSEFGVVLIERGHEVGGGDTRFGVGCVARILQTAESEDGRLALATVGDRRIRVERWLPDDPFPRAEVYDWPDPLPTADEADQCSTVAAELRRVLGLAAELGDRVPPIASVKPATGDPAVTSFQLAALAPVGPLDRLALLSAGSVSDRLGLLSSLLSDIGGLLASRLGTGG